LNFVDHQLKFIAFGSVYNNKRIWYNRIVKTVYNMYEKSVMKQKSEVTLDFGPDAFGHIKVSYVSQVLYLYLLKQKSELSKGKFIKFFGSY